MNLIICGKFMLFHPFFQKFHLIAKGNNSQLSTILRTTLMNLKDRFSLKPNPSTDFVMKPTEKHRTTVNFVILRFEVSICTAWHASSTIQTSRSFSFPSLRWKGGRVRESNAFSSTMKTWKMDILSETTLRDTRPINSFNLF